MEYTGRRQNGINGRGLKLPQLVSSKGEVRRVLNGPDGTVIYLGEATYRGDYISLEMDLKP